MAEMITIKELIVDQKIEPECVVAAILAHGVSRVVAYDHWARVTDAAALEMARGIPRFIDLSRSGEYDESLAYWDHFDEGSWFIECGWNRSNLPIQLRPVPTPSKNEDRLSKAEGYGFKAPIGRSRRLNGVAKIAPLFGLTRQALSKSILLALDQREARRRDA